MRRLSTIAMLAAGMLSLLLGSVAHAQKSEISDVRAMLSAASASSGTMLSQTGVYSGVIAYRGPQEVNAWGMGSMYWPREIPYNAPTPTFFSGGVDVMTPLGVIIGVAGSTSNLHARLEDGGSYRQDGTAGTLYANYNVGGVWVGDLTLGAQAQISKLGYSAQMNSMENAMLFMNVASPRATATIEEISASWLITQRWFQHGPLASLRVSSARLDSFAEAGSVFSRSFSDAAISQFHGSVGYQVKFTYDRFQPFASAQTTYLFSQWATPVLAQLVTGGPVDVSLPPTPTERNTYSSVVGLRIFLTPAVTALMAWGAAYHHDGRFISNDANLGVSVGF
jgi:uncharacterized protein YhjY with autotransporter beta-barrel domain